MDIKTYRAASMHEALALVRRDLGPDAAVLHTREVRRGRLFGLLPGSRQIEVTASANVNVPSRLPPSPRPPTASGPAARLTPPPPASPSAFPAAGKSPSEPYGPPLRGRPYSSSATPTMPPASTPTLSGPSSPSPSRFGGDLSGQLDDLRSMLQDLCHRSRGEGLNDLPDSLFRLFTDLIEADVSEEIARELVEQVRREAPNDELADPLLVKERVTRTLAAEIPIAGAITVTPGRRRLVALVGPTGVGKTTTIAKLAANYRLKEKRNVGLITVDTYRIAAVEQLRTYADIIDLPMEVVSTLREMREAVRRFDSLDLVLMDTAGRSPRDEIKIQELRSFLSEAGADEVHLVLSSVAGARALKQTAQQFAAAGTTGLILTKLDEATTLGNLLPVLRESGLPLSYLTNGQNVPDDIETAVANRVARLVLDTESTFANGR